MLSIMADFHMVSKFFASCLTNCEAPFNALITLYCKWDRTIQTNIMFDSEYNPASRKQKDQLYFTLTFFTASLFSWKKTSHIS